MGSYPVQGSGMGIIVKPGINKIDDTFNLATVTANQTLILKTYTGTGSVQIVCNADGDSQVNMQYIIDGGAPVTITTADIRAEVVVGFKTSLIIQAVNTVGSTKNYATSSAAGTIQ